MKRMIGAYIITHSPTGYYYIGSTGNFRERYNQHRKHLSGNRHANYKLQSIFTSREDLEYEFFPTPTREAAYLEEQRLLDKHYSDRFCCNVGKSSLDPTLGVITLEMRQANIQKAAQANIGRKFSTEHREKLSLSHLGNTRSDETRAAISLSKSRAIEIDGIRYASIAIASTELQINPNTIRTRLRKCTEEGSTKYRFID